MGYDWGSSSISVFEGPWSSCSAASHHPESYNLNLVDGPRRSRFSRIEPIIEDNHFDLSIGLSIGEGEGECERSSEEVGYLEVRDRNSSRPLVLSMLGLECSKSIASSDALHHRRPHIHAQIHVKSKVI